MSDFSAMENMQDIINELRKERDEWHAQLKAAWASCAVLRERAERAEKALAAWNEVAKAFPVPPNAVTYEQGRVIIDLVELAVKKGMAL